MKTKKDPQDREKMLAVFKEVWRERKHVSEVSGTRLSSQISTLFFHHILPKQKYREAMLDKENIILLTPEEHANVEVNKYRYEKINLLREKLLEKYLRLK